MKIVLAGATVTVGKNILKSLDSAKCEVIRVGNTRGDFSIDMEEVESIRALYRRLGSFDAVVSASGSVVFSRLIEVSAKDWLTSIGSKLLGQINLVQEALPYINPNGSFTLISGIVGKVQIPTGAIAATVNGALENYVRAAACELPKNLRINIVRPSLLKDSHEHYGSFFPGIKPVSGTDVASAYHRSIFGIETGQTYSVE